MVFDLNLKCNVSIITTLWTQKENVSKYKMKRRKFGQTTRPWDSFKELLFLYKSFLFLFRLSWSLERLKTFQKGRDVTDRGLRYFFHFFFFYVIWLWEETLLCRIKHILLSSSSASIKMFWMPIILLLPLSLSQYLLHSSASSTQSKDWFWQIFHWNNLFAQRLLA